MGGSEFEAFLKEAGYAYEMETSKEVQRFTFRDRGCTFIGIANDADRQFLFLKAEFALSSEPPDIERLRQIMRDLEDEYPVVKLRSSTAGTPTSFEVITEQFESDPQAVGAIFWRTLDVMREVGNECYRRLETPPENPPSNDFRTRIEAALMRSCANGDACTYRSATDLIRLSLALVVDDEGHASAFCVASSRDASVYVTNAHVVGEQSGVTLYRQYPVYDKMMGTVLVKGDPNGRDLALISVPVPEIPAVTISARPPRSDMPIALAGYPHVQILAADELGELFSATHMGTITAVNHDGSIILHDALSRPGNSGGPLFDPVTAEVFGVECSGWESEEEAVAVGYDALVSFLKENNVAFNRPEGTPQGDITNAATNGMPADRHAQEAADSRDALPISTN